MNSSTGSGCSGAKKGVFALKWNSFTDHISKGLGELYQDDAFADVTLACEDQFIKAHKLILSMCSPFFKKLFEANNDRNANTIVILNQVKFQDLEKIKTFIYQGKVNIAQSDLNRFLECAELLQVKGLSSFSSKRQKIEAAANFNTNVNSSDIFSPGNSSSSNNSSTTRKMPLRQNKLVTRSSPQCPTSTTSMKDLMNNLMKQQQEENDDLMTRRMNSDSLPYEIDPLDDDGFDPSNETNIINSNMMKDEGAGSYNDHEQEQDFISGNLEDYLEEEYEEEYNPTGTVNYYQVAEDLEDGEITGTVPAAAASTNVNVGQRGRVGGTLKSRKRARAKPKSKLVKSGKMYRKCPYCKIQIYKSNLSRHIATIHTQILLEKGEKLFRCNICKQLYRNVGHLKLHMEKNHFGETSPQE